MARIGYKIVNFPIEVPLGNYCWNFINNVICKYFDNTGGHNYCELGFLIGYKSSRNGVKKADRCRKLKGV